MIWKDIFAFGCDIEHFEAEDEEGMDDNLVQHVLEMNEVEKFVQMEAVVIVKLPCSLPSGYVAVLPTQAKVVIKTEVVVAFLSV